MAALHRVLPALGARGVLVVHDEYLAECPAAAAAAVRDCVEQTMVAQMATVVSRVPTVVEAEIVEAWR